MKFSNILKPAMFVAVILSLSSFLETATEKFQVDTKASTLTWTAKKVTGSHTGTVPLAAGEFSVDGKNIKSGTFEIDLASLTVTDITDPKSNAKLVGHLKSDDFFSTEKFPKAVFVLTTATAKSEGAYALKGNLTIKGITKEIEFPATLVREDKKITATAKITVDRTLYDIRYRSKNFFENLGDKAIDDEFTLDLKLVGVSGGI
jgi:polyisoprenoid-binding protein YceI